MIVSRIVSQIQKCPHKISSVIKRSRLSILELKKLKKFVRGSLNISINRFCMKYMTINTLCTIVLCVNLPVGLLCIYPHSSQFKGFLTLFYSPAMFLISQSAGFYQINKYYIYNIHVPQKSQKKRWACVRYMRIVKNFIPSTNITYTLYNIHVLEKAHGI